MALAEGVHGVFNPTRQLGVHVGVEAAHGAQQAHMVGDHIEGLAALDAPEAHHHRVQGIEAAADRLLQAAHHPRRDPDGIGALVGPGAVAALAQHLHLQLPRRGREAAAAHPDRARRQGGKHVHAKQSVHALHGAISLHPGRPLGRFLGGLKQQPHTGREPLGMALGQPSEQARHPQPHGGVQIVAAGMHQPLLGGGVVEAGALLHRQGIHVHPQGHQGRGPAIGQLSGPQLGHHPGASDALAHLPAPAA